MRLASCKRPPLLLWITHLPSVVEFIVAHKVGVIALECVEDERLVRLGDLVFHESPLVRQVHLGRERARIQTGQLGVQLQVHSFGGLDAQDELVATDVFENTRGDVLELNSHFYLGVVQGLKPQTRRRVSQFSLYDHENIFTFPGFKDEGDALPTRIVDPQSRRSESRACGIWRDSAVIKVAGFSVGTHVLAEKYVLLLYRVNCTEDLHLNVDAGIKYDTR